MSIPAYIAAIQSEAARGVATEHTFRPALKALIESLDTGIAATNEPRRIACGAPDYQVTRGALPVGHIEAKDLHVDLDKEQRGEQIGRYLRALPNLILTNYLEFRWYVNGELRETARIGRLPPLRPPAGGTPLRPPASGGIRGGYGRITREAPGEADLLRLLQGFLAQQPPVTGTPRELALRLANMARLTRGLIAETFKREGERGELHEQYDAFKRALIPGLDADEFADMYAQTLAYGLFAARIAHPEAAAFARESASRLLPRTNPFLRRLFYEIAGPDLDDRIAWAVDDIAALLNRANMDEILHDFGKRTRQEDPIVHFYETFLAAYDPKLRESRGVYYTPEPVVSFIVRSVDQLLRTRFGKPLGLADRDTLILDPATGTATFPYFVIEQIYETLRRNGMAGGWSSYVGEGEKSLLRRLFGFELLMAPYAVAHLKLGLQLQEKGYDFRGDERLGVYLTNALDEGVPAQTAMPFARYIAEESQAAAEIKSSRPIMVVLGNPPYSNFSGMNKGNWILKLLEDYKKNLNEKKINLDDDYIKFIRFGQWRIEKTGVGILTLITNNSYIDGITHRRMRQSLMETFTDIYILNLHGNSNKGEISPDGSPDKNVFDIQQGVTIGIFVKEPRKNTPAKVHYAELWGTREGKYSQLLEADVTTIKWKELTDIAQRSCLGTFYFFTPKAFENIDEYCKSWNIKDALSHQQNGLKTDRDSLFFDLDRDTLDQRMRIFYSDAGIQSPFRETYEVENSSSYALLERRERTSFNPSNIAPCLYRPFDTRWLYYSPGLTSRPAWEVMRHMLAHNNVGLIGTRQTSDEWGVLVTENICGHKSCAAYDINSLFPLYLYPAAEGDTRRTRQTSLFDADSSDRPSGRRPNLNPDFIRILEEKLGLRFVPDGSGDAVEPHPPTPSPSAGRGSGGNDGGAWATPPALWEKLKPLARQMRREPTPAEDVLWQALRDRQLDGFKFRRQHAIGRFIVDFYCRDAELVVEVDGPIHEYSQEEDVIRQTFLESRGLQVLRFTNAQVLQAPADVLAIIRAALNSPSPRTESRSSFPPQAGGRKGGEVPSTFGPEDIFHYAYAVFHSPTYRARYAELLKIDFPRLPLTSDVALFADLAALGAELVDLHLLRLPDSPPLPSQRERGLGGEGLVGGAGGAAALLHLRTSFPVGGSNIVEQVRYSEGEQRVYINKTQYFEGINPAIWAFRVGGYQVLDKWLKDRKGRALSFDDLLHYQRVVVALAETRRIMAAIDECIGGWPIT